MQITYIAEPDQKPIYKTTINLSNGDEQSIEGPASTSGFTANYYQNLCYSYLESNKFANINEDLLNSEIILEKMSTFKDCYTKLEQLMQKCKITIANNSIFYSSESEIEPEKEEILEACDSKTTDDELVI